MKQYLSIAVTSMLLAAALTCEDTPPTIDAGPDPSISDCCNWYIVPLYYDRPQVCLDKHSYVCDAGETTPAGCLIDHQCRWLECLGGIVDYWACNCGGRITDGHCP